MSYVNEQPGATAPPSVDRFRGIKRYGKKFTTRDGWLGDYDFGSCSPGLPWGKRKASRAPQFYALDADLPILLAMTCGFQHALAMLAGLITPPIIFSSALNLDGSTQAYMRVIDRMWDFIPSSNVPAPHLAQLLPRDWVDNGRRNELCNAFYRILGDLYANGTCPTTTAADGTVTRGPCPDAYGMLLGMFRTNNGSGVSSSSSTMLLP
ncbi:Purine permease, partial [Rhizoctonia solani]